ncbi:protein disulfide isomerase [Mycena maculata]|uniref:Protein disulfide isomerase n=1 Tax=Mycena maculata TaxID=230809 RepID=A0AAD7IG11_9AGAR|nr:protein disulfide isomerase [Mycena maculata]
MLLALRELPVSILLTFFALACAALPAQTASTLKPPLTPDNFKPTIAKGVWFVEHFSPYCGHCRAFLPTWEKLVEQSENSAGVQLAQVDCSVNGDLCNANGVSGYPQLHLYRDGEFVEKYKGSRDFDVVTEYLAGYLAMHAPIPELPSPLLTPAAADVILNPSGEVTVLTPDNFRTTLDQGPAFIKFYAPWCGHCKKLAPIWKQLAKLMEAKVTIAEVNCEAHEKFCKSQGVGGFPTLMYYPPGGEQTEYMSGRKLEQLKSFVEKASASATQPIQPEEVDAYVTENPVIYLLLHPAGDSDLLKTVARLAAPLLGSPLIYTSPSPILFKRFSIPESAPWAIVSLKDRNPRTAAAMYIGSATLDTNGDLPAWLLANRLPTSMELTQDTFQSVMNAPHKPLVVIASVNSDTRDKVAERFRDIALKWRVHTGGTGIFHGRSVVFTWMDAEKWESWLKSMYGLKKPRGTDVEDVGVIIADHKVLKYYNTEQSDAPIKLTSPSIFSALEGAASGTIRAKESENFVERMARWLNSYGTALEVYVLAHPLYTLFILSLVLAVGYLALTRFLGDSSAHEREHGYSKSGRMD